MNPGLNPMNDALGIPWADIEDDAQPDSTNPSKPLFTTEDAIRAHGLGVVIDGEAQR